MTAPRTLTAESLDRMEQVLVGAGAGPATPGFAAVVVLDGEVAYCGARGRANLEYDVPITPRTTFHIASMSKQFAGFALATVADRGLLDLDADVRSYLPDIPDLGTALTARQLAHHTSGLRDQWGELVFSGWRMDDVITTADVLALVRRMEGLNFPPGTGFSYSNTGYTLMGELVRAVDGRTLREFCEQDVFAPLGMTDTHFHDRHDELVPGRAYSYVATRDGRFTHAVLSYATVGATSLHTTVEDLARWDRNFTVRAVGTDGAFALLDTPGVLADGTSTGYAFGLMHDSCRGQRRVHHSGGDAGFRSQGERFPELGFAVYVLANSGASDVVALAGGLRDIVLDQLGVPAAGPVAGAAVSDPARYAGSFIERSTGYPITLTLDDGTLRFQGAPVTERAPGVLGVGAAVTLRFAEPPGPADSVELAVTAIAPARLERYEPVQPTPAELAELVGTYWSDELETRYRVELVDGTLSLVHHKHGSLALAPTVRDGFLASTAGLIPMPFAVVFDRDAAGTVTGFRLSMPRVSNVSARRL